MKITKNCMVTLRHRVTDSFGGVVDDGGAPLLYLHGGYGGIFAKLEAALEGKAVGDGIEVTLEPRDGFGVPDPALIARVPADCFPTPPQVGDGLEGDFGGTAMQCRVTAADARLVTLDANHPFAGMTLVFTATVQEVRPATDEEVASALQGLTRTVAEGKATERAFVQLKAESEAATLAEAEAADLVAAIRVPYLNTRFHLVFRSQAHKLCWLAPLFLLPALAGWLGIRGWTTACGSVVALWLAWTYFAPAVIRMAIDRWGYRFLLFDFSPNLNPSRLERFIVNGGNILSVLVVLGFTVVALFRLDHPSELLTLVGVDIAILVVLSILLAVLLPFLVMVLTGFRVRPVIDKAPAGAETRTGACP